MGCIWSRNEYIDQKLPTKGTDLIFLSNDKLEEGFYEDEYYLPLDNDVPGGFHICMYKYANLLNIKDINYIWRVKIPKQEVIAYNSVYKHFNEIKLDEKCGYKCTFINKKCVYLKCAKIYIYDKQYIWTNEELCKHFLKLNPNYFKKIENITKDIIYYAISHGVTLDCIPKKFITPYLLNVALNKNGLNLQYVDDKNEILSFLAVKRDGLALEFVPYEIQNYKICIYAIKQNAKAIYFVKNKLIYDKLKDYAHNILHTN